MNANSKSRPTNSLFKIKTGLDIEYLNKLNDNEAIELYEFLTQSSAGRKFALNASKKDSRLQIGNRRLGQENKEVINYADKTIALIKNESDQKLINIANSIRNLLTKPITKIKRQDIQDILTLIKQSLWF